MKAMLPILAMISSSAVGESVVVHFPDLTHSASVQDHNAAFPDVMLGFLPLACASQGCGLSIGLMVDFFDDQNQPECMSRVEGFIPSADLYWPIVWCGFGGYPQSLFPHAPVFPQCDHCDWDDGSHYVLDGRWDRFLLQIRVGDSDDATSWRYGWVAYEVVTLLNTTCNETCEDWEVYLPRFNFLAFALETEYDTPIIAGGGLCLADLNLDAVIDLADVVAFASSFLEQEPASDFNNDGLHDLADVVAFVIAFGAPCVLGEPPR